MVAICGGYWGFAMVQSCYWGKQDGEKRLLEYKRI